MARAWRHQRIGRHRGEERGLQRILPAPVRRASCARSAREGDERLEVGPVHLTPAVLEIADQLDEPAGQRHVHAEALALRRPACRAGRPPRSCACAPRGRARCRSWSWCARGSAWRWRSWRARARSASPASAARYQAGSNSSKGSMRTPALSATAIPSPTMPTSALLHAGAPLHHLVHVGVHHRGPEEERAVDELGPLVAPDIVGDRRLLHRAQQRRQLLGRAG